MEVVEGFKGENVVRREARGDVVEGIHLEERKVLCEGEVLEGVLRVLIVGTRDFGLAFKESGF